MRLRDFWERGMGNYGNESLKIGRIGEFGEWLNLRMGGLGLY